MKIHMEQIFISAIACSLAKAWLDASILMAKDYLTGALKAMSW